MSGNYVIVGNGFSAALNHYCLRHSAQGKLRAQGLEILHIGADDPWLSMDVEQMGQWPALLTLPGFPSQFQSERLDNFLPCRSFAANTKACLASLTGSPLKAEVIGITRSQNGSYQISYREDGKEEIQELEAAKIDFCGGLGPAKRIDQIAAYPSNSRKSSHRPVLSGVDFLRSQEDVPPGGRLCVCGNGGTAAWCVERALSKNCREVVWVSRTKFDEATFPSSRRNHRLIAASSLGSGLKDFRPIDPKLKIVWGYEVKSVEPGLEVSFGAYDPALCGSIDHTGDVSSSPLAQQPFDQLVIAIGQAYPPTLLSDLQKAKYPIITPGDELLAGYADHPAPEESRLRILGPAVRAVGARGDRAAPYMRKLTDYLETLPSQARGGHIAAQGMLIAKANGFWPTGQPNRNINTLYKEDLLELNMADAEIIDWLVDRQDRTDPYWRRDQQLAQSGLSIDYGL